MTCSQIETYVNRPAPTYRVQFDNVRVPERRRIDAGFKEIMAGFNRERVMVAARWLRPYADVAGVGPRLRHDAAAVRPADRR